MCVSVSQGAATETDNRTLDTRRRRVMPAAVVDQHHAAPGRQFGHLRPVMVCSRKLPVVFRPQALRHLQGRQRDTDVSFATLGYDFKLEHLPSRMRYAGCHSSLVDVEWIVSNPTPAPVPLLFHERPRA